MSHDRTYGHTDAGRDIKDAHIERLAEEAERGYGVETLLKRRDKRGRPALGSAPASVESVRLDPELRAELVARAESEGTTTSDVIRKALRRYLHAA
jgi:CRISPR-associated endonuclease/helicase Cas3